jgi:hypothetical protein
MGSRGEKANILQYQVFISNNYYVRLKVSREVDFALCGFNPSGTRHTGRSWRDERHGRAFGARAVVVRARELDSIEPNPRGRQSA